MRPGPSRGRRRVVIRWSRQPLASSEQVFGGERPKAGRVRVLGVDPGLTRCGLGVVEGAPAGRWRSSTSTWSVPPQTSGGARACAASRPSSSTGSTCTARRGGGRAGLRPAQRDDRDGHRSGERGGPGRGRTAGDTGRPAHTRARSRRPSPAAAGPTRHQVTAMVTRLLRLTARPAPADAADALALAICHLWRGRGERPARCRRGGGRSAGGR